MKALVVRASKKNSAFKHSASAFHPFRPRLSSRLRFAVFCDAVRIATISFASPRCARGSIAAARCSR